MCILKSNEELKQSATQKRGILHEKEKYITIIKDHQEGNTSSFQFLLRICLIYSRVVISFTLSKPKRCSSPQIYPVVKQCLMQLSSNLNFTFKANARYESYWNQFWPQHEQKLNWLMHFCSVHEGLENFNGCINIQQATKN